MSYRTYLTALAPGAYWPLDRPTAPTEVIAALSSTLEGGAALGAAGPLTVDPSTCASFDGSDDRINITDAAVLDLTTNWTVSFWFNGDGFGHGGGGNFPRILSKGSGSGAGYQFLVDLAAGPKLALQTQGLSDTTHQTVSTIAVATWYHVVTTYDGANVRIYLNGVLDYTGPATGSMTTNATALYLGQRGDASGRWDGRIAHVAIWNGTVLSAVQAGDLYAARALPPVSTQARFGTARFGATRFNDFTPNVVLIIDGVDRTHPYLDWHSLQVSLRRNDQPSSASLTIMRNAVFTPEVGQTYAVCLGSASNPIIAGQIMGRVRRRTLAADLPTFLLSCGDWRKEFNSTMVTGNFSGQSATDIAIAITPAGFSTAGIEAGLAVQLEFICINEERQAVLARLATGIGGASGIDPLKVVHLYGSAGPTSSYAPTDPTTLTNDLSTLEEIFEPEDDYSQLRTRVIVEGRSTKTLTYAPAGTDAYTYGLPIEYGWMFSPQGGAPANVSARIGSQVLSFSARTGSTGTYGPPAAQLTAAANPGDTSIAVVSNVDLDTYMFVGWMRDEAGNWFRGSSPYLSGLGSSTAIINIPASGYGSIQQTIAAGAAIYAGDCLLGIAQEDGTPGLISEVPAGETVTVRVVEDDAAAQALYGIYEHTIEDDTLSYAGGEARALADLALFTDPLLRLPWTTRDMNAVPGARQVLDLSAPDVLTGTLTIDSVTLTFPERNAPPRRRCEGSTAQQEDFIDAIKG